MANTAPVYFYGASHKEYCEKIKKIYKEKGAEKPWVYAKTYGCQQNVSDTEKYLGMFIEMGFGIASCKEKADVILFNTCAIRENAENKVFGNVGIIKRLKKDNPDLFIILCGCMTEQESALNKIKSTYPFVDLIFGTHGLNRFPQIFYDALILKKQKPKSVITQTEKENYILENAPMYKDVRLRAFVSVMYGCNNFCSYCIVPYVRGRERSRGSQKILKEFADLLKAGYKDITLLGQNVNSYGKGLEEKIDFPELLEMLDNFGGEYIIRFMTSHPKDATKKLIDTIAKSRHIEHHLHLPVQSGSNRVLKEMNRSYTRESYLETIDYAKLKIPDVTFSSDIIVGFPGETEKEFSETLDLIKKVGYCALFTFIYSARPGTAAAKLFDPFSKHEKTERMLRLLKIQEEISENLCKKMVRKSVRFLAESFNEQKMCVCGRTSGNIPVEAKCTRDLTGRFLNCEITNSKRESLEGTVI